MNFCLHRLWILIALIYPVAYASAQHISDNTKLTVPSSEKASELRELIAGNMLIYQRSSGGWPKHIDNVKIDYTKKLAAGDEAGVKDDASRNDATIDNGATVKEIRFLAEQYSLTKKATYLSAVERGISYLLKAQYANGGWPQFFPDTSNYRKHITYNDNAMVNVLSLLQDVGSRANFMETVNKSLVLPAQKAVEKGIGCIINTQVKVNGKHTAWCAQHDKNTLLPANARSYELISLSGMESVTILEFLMRQKNPSDKIKTAVVAGINWLKAAQLKGYRYGDIPDPSKPQGYDRLLVKDPKAVVWARFYEVQTNEPFVSGRDGIKKKDLMDIEYERRAGYRWYGTWPKNLLDVEFPAWATINLSKSVSSK